MVYIKKINKRAVAEEKNKFKIRLKNVLKVFFVAFAVVIGHLTYIIFVKGDIYKTAAHNQQTKSQIISPSRGIIYDTNGEILASSVMVDTVSFSPGKVKYENGKTVEEDVLAQKFSELFDITYEDALTKVHSNSAVIVIARKVDKEVVEQLQTWMSENKITSGINIDSDTKRNYPNGTLASTLIGFCGTDNDGRSGLEERWDDVLTGTAGKRTVTLDVNKDAIPDGIEEYVAAENGSNIYLTIDSKIQGICERYLKQAVIDENADSGGVIVMNPQNGEILAMANYPDYDLNDPFNVEPTGLADSWSTLSQEEKNNAYYSLWRNKNVSDLYEPGSTFKLLVSAIALEEELVETDTENDFHCEKVYKVGDEEISCWAPSAHGSLTLRRALEKSCNPSFMQLGQRIGVSRFYKYFSAFGLFDKVGSDIAMAQKSIFYEEEKVGPVELATMSFGQRFSITPLQLITAVSAIANDGVLVKPKIVKQIENVDTGSITTVETEEIRQVISEETAAQVKGMMKSVVTEGTGGWAAVEGYEIGGKSGTSEPQAGKEDEGYVASFIAISPIENTQVVCLVILYNPKNGNYQGGTTCGPIASDILSEVLPYIGMTSSNSAGNISVADSKKAITDVKGLTVKDAREKLESSGYTVVANVQDESATKVTDQMPKAGIYLDNGSKVYLYTTDNEVRTTIEVPNVKGLTIEEAKAKLKQQNLNVIVEGTRGVVVSQSISAGNMTEAGTVINIVVKEELSGGQ